VITVCGKDEADISQPRPEERQEFLKDLGLSESSMERLMLRLRGLGLINFFTSVRDECGAGRARK